MINENDSIIKEESRITEEKLKRALIERETSERGKEVEKKKTSISEFKRQIEELKALKQEYHDKGEHILYYNIFPLGIFNNNRYK